MTFDIRSLVRIAGAVAFAAAIGFASAARAEEPLELYALLPITGPLAFYGQSIAASLGAVSQTVNNSGGVAGRPIHFTVLDDQANPQVAVHSSLRSLPRASPSSSMAGRLQRVARPPRS
jgi:hypothetical protein